MRRLVRGLLQISILFCTAFFSSALPCSIEEDALVIYYDRHRCALVVTENSTFFEGVARRNPPCPQFCLVVATNYSGIVLLSEEGSIRFPFELNLSQVLDQNGRTNSSGNVVNCSLLLQKLGFEVISNLQSDPSKHGEVLRKRRNRLIVVAPFSIVLTVVMIAIVVCHQCRLKPQYISFQKKLHTRRRVHFSEVEAGGGRTSKMSGSGSKTSVSTISSNPSNGHQVISIQQASTLASRC
ncbi:hypothetical protein QR680_006547 [Steinernema hermaphroditum]|uniref:Uncharacterized protein n=1 Tax=Steinernema hermaphroditum TaxID=289476 RepID=A0AA39HY67_9BILA|nr:hypothetical protein QR680_006547 [Steinernema hermaphroditum]